MNELTVFNNEQFGEIRTVESDGTIWFVASDVCRALEISNPSVAVDRLDEDERSKFNIGRQGMTNCVNEYGLYGLVLGSRKKSANDFKRWIKHDVLPSIRKTGAYVAPQEEGVPAVRMSDVLLAMSNVAKLAESNQQSIVENQRRIHAMEAELKESGEKIDAALDALAAPSFRKETWREDTRTAIADIVEQNGMSYHEYTRYLYKRLERVAGVDLTARQVRRRNRMKLAGATETEMKNVSKLACIEADQKLRAIFDHIISEEKAARLMKGGHSA